MGRFSVLWVLVAVTSWGAFPEPYDGETGDDPEPAAAAAAFALPDGVTVSVFAAEPMVRNPIASCWDHRGRLWVAENYTYAERRKRFDLNLRDRVIVLADADGDGVADKRTVFADDLQMLTSVLVGKGGVWVTCPPQLLFIPDADGDDRPDGPPRVMLDGFTVAQSNYHNFANGLKWGPDGWLYGRCGHSCPGDLGVPGTVAAERVPIDGGIWRYHPGTKRVEVLTHGTVNPWGSDWDKHGEMFHVNTVIGHLWHVIPGAHYKESWGQSRNPLVYERIGMHADHWHFDRGKGWQKSRHGEANDHGGGHCHVGAAIYQGEALPAQFRDRLLTWNTHGLRANVERLERHGSGYVGRHEADALVTTDKWFRGVEMSVGPDGALYGLDWRDTGECHEHTGVHRSSGRILRFAGAEIARPAFDFAESAANLERALTVVNPWYFRQLCVQLPAGLKPRSEALLRARLDEDGGVVARLRALWLLYQRRAVGQGELLALLGDEDEHVRTWAVRLLTDHWRQDTLAGPRGEKGADSAIAAQFAEFAKGEESGLVRLALASALQRLPVGERTALAVALASRAGDAADHNLPLMVWYGIMATAEAQPETLVRVAEATVWPGLLAWIARTAAAEPEGLSKVLAVALAQPKKAAAILAGVTAAYEGWARAPKPENWEAVVAEFADDAELGAMVAELSGLFGAGRSAAELVRVVDDGGAALAVRQRALAALVKQRPAALRAVCERQLFTRGLTVLALSGLATYDDPAIGNKVVEQFRRFRRAEERAAAVDLLCSRSSWAGALLAGLESKKVARSAVTAFHARQIMGGLEDEEMRQRLERVWGVVRASDDAKQREMAALKKALTPAVLGQADLANGRRVYQAVCAACHRLYGEGGTVGPDLTGSGRGELDYLLENIVDPSGVLGAEYQVTTLTLTDGRVLTGVVAKQTEKTVTLRQLTLETTIERELIEEQTKLTQSMMPEGLLGALTEAQVRDLIGYLMHPKQVGE